MAHQPVQLPGFGLPVTQKPSDPCFPNAIMDWAVEPSTVRERTMVALMESITDKPEWDRKVFEEAIVQKWRQEAMQSDMDVSEKMLDWIVAELQDKARSYQQDGLISTLGLDAIVVKSDTAIPPEMNEELRAACKPLEDVHPTRRDWHPGSGERVLNLVHPSLFPLVYGKSNFLPVGRMGVADCMEHIGKGVTTAKPDELEILNSSAQGVEYNHHTEPVRFWSRNFQWLPCNVEFVGSEAVKITSYINNLHPMEYSTLYAVVEACIAKSIPLWNRTLSSAKTPCKRRLEVGNIEYTFPNGQEVPRDTATDSDDSEEIDYGKEWVRKVEWLKANRLLILPEPGAYQPVEGTASVDLRKQFFKNGLQVIIKLANIELSPEKPDYEGGSWHIEGQLNERICASALYYYDSDNVTESFLAFRQRTDDAEEIEWKKFDQHDHDGIADIYGIENDEPRLQTIGRVLTRQGRLLAFPNVLQHRVSPFRLQDPSKPGHRKLLALFLVDPYIPIISTANVPPQQKEWWVKQLADENTLSMLPRELADQVIREVSSGMIGFEEAKRIRLELMRERKAFVDVVEMEMQGLTFDFCEH